MDWLFVVTGVIGLVIMWAVAALVRWIASGWVWPVFLVIAGIVWALVFIGAALDIWRLSRSLG